MSGGCGERRSTGQGTLPPPRGKWDSGGPEARSPRWRGATSSLDVAELVLLPARYAVLWATRYPLRDFRGYRVDPSCRDQKAMKRSVLRRFLRGDPPAATVGKSLPVRWKPRPRPGWQTASVSGIERGGHQSGRGTSGRGRGTGGSHLGRARARGHLGVAGVMGANVVA